VANCANCGAPLHIDREGGLVTCRHCGSSEPQGSIARLVEAGSQSDRTCPTCATLLADSRLDGVPLLFCQRCEGMLIPMAEFVSVIEAVRAHETPAEAVPPRRQSPGDRTINCPACAKPMLSHFYGGPGNLVIDTCERCHLNWLDPGELRRIARARD
jgi:Zn-finger nucleic acid-binding protein